MLAIMAVGDLPPNELFALARRSIIGDKAYPCKLQLVWFQGWEVG